ncbi:MAG: TetR family transcriptional regulator [Acidimicrobiales bacterium]|nr:MAG: TetR family transcriptional regulator [Acidimicrobiales bacterium]
MAADSTAKKRGSYKSSEQVRRRLLEAAIVEFADHGFEGASTRAIARRAGAHQPQINYHFESKDALWRAAMDMLLEEIDGFITIPDDDAEIRSAMETMIRGLVHFAAARPEMHRIMIKEASSPGQRLTWLVETHVRPRYDAFRIGWDALAAAGHSDHIPPELAYHLMVGAASLLHANAPEAEALVGVRASDPATVEAHADAMVRLFIR